MIRRTIGIGLTLGLYAGLSWGQAPQQISLQQGPKTWVSQRNPDTEPETWRGGWHRACGLIAFREIPSPAFRAEMEAQGLSLHHALGSGLYLASWSGRLTDKPSLWTEITHLSPLPADWKRSPYLPKEALGRVSLALCPAVAPDWARAQLRRLGLEVAAPQELGYQAYVELWLNTPAQRDRVLALPWVWALEPALPAEEVLNQVERSTHRVSPMQGPFPGARNLLGQGMHIAIGDGGFVQPHVDFRHRLNNLENATFASFGTHQDHVTGTVGSQGVVNPLRAGTAPAAQLYTARTVNIQYFLPWLMAEKDVRVSNNSYGNSLNCANVGRYDIRSQFLDRQARTYANLLQVFAAGNSGGSNCSPYSSGFQTVLDGSQAAKNILTVGNSTTNEGISGSSSKGPLRDGRVKPDLVAVGTNVLSTVPNSSYGNSSGTSMSAPAVTGAAALLNQRHRQLHGNAHIPATLAKALLLNGAEDLGNAGPDFTFGYGRINLARAIEALEAGQYISGSLTQGQQASHPLTLPASQAQLRVMLCWLDPEAFTLSTKALVNDLDLEVLDPASNTWRPWVLNPAAGSVSALATRGIDTLNNTEQVTLETPAAGSYTLRVKGSEVPMGPQDYVLVWYYAPPHVQLVYPLGSEKLTNGTNRIIWDRVGIESGTYSLHYSTDNGSNWTLITTGLATSTRYFDWNTPALNSSTVKVRISHSSGLYTSESGPNILVQGIPTLTNTPCAGHDFFTWTSVTGATQYQLLGWRHTRWDTLGSFASSGVRRLSDASVSFYAVQAVFADGSISRRSVAVAASTSNANCNASVPDLSVAEVVNLPRSSRANTPTALTASHTLTVRLRNIHNAAYDLSPVTLRASLNGGSPQSLSLSGSLAANTLSGDYSFASPLNLASPGSYTVRIWLDIPSEANRLNDTLVYTFRQLANPPLTLPWVQTLETATDTAYTASTVGLAGLEAWDFESAANTRLRTAVFPHLSQKGSFRALTLDRSSGGTAQTAYALYTANLSTYAGADSLFLDFDYMLHGNSPAGDDKVWARASASDTWTEVFDLGAHGTQGVVTPVRRLNLRRFIGPPSSSFQLRFGHSVADQAQFTGFGDGVSIDALRLSAPGSDVEMLGFLSPVAGCTAGSPATVAVRVFNRSNAPLSNVPVAYTWTGGSIQSGTISSIPARDSVDYTFAQTLNTTINTHFDLSAWVALPADGYPSNDTARYQVGFGRAISIFPYQETFEAGTGGWYTQGINSSWQHGSTAKAELSTRQGNGKLWTTNLSGTYFNNENSFLHSPCFDLSAMQTDPILRFDLFCALDPNDQLWLEYSDDGTTWKTLGQSGQGTNWYNFSGYWSYMTGGAWAQASYTFPLDSVQDRSAVRFRFRFFSGAYLTMEGVAIDNFSLSEPYTLALDGNTPGPWCSGQEITVAYTASGFNPGNTFSLQLSSPSGSFANPTVLGSQPGTGDGVFVLTLPDFLAAGSGYRLRVQGSNPLIPSADNGVNISLEQRPARPNASANAVVLGDTLRLVCAPVAGATGYRWEGPNGFVSSQQNPKLAPATAAESGLYTVVVLGTACESEADSLVVTVAQPLTWTGAVNTSFHEPGNWNPALAPAADKDLIIPASRPRMPQLSSDASARKLDLRPGASLGLGNQTLHQSGDIQLSGTLSYGTSGRLSLEAPQGRQTVVSSTRTLARLRVDAGDTVIWQGSLSLTQDLEVAQGTFQVANSHTLTLLANASQDARLAPLGAQAAVRGTVRVQRHIPGTRKQLYMLGAPVLGQTLANLRPRIEITGSFPGADPGPTSLWFYSPAGVQNSGYMEPSSISQALPPGKGLAIYIKSVFFLSGQSLLTLSGEAAQGGLTVNLDYCPSGCSYTNPNGWNLVANPYACPVDWHSLGKNQVNGSFHVWKKNVYATWSEGLNLGTNGASRYIATMQGFFVEAQSAAASLQFQESAKALGQNPAFLRTGAETRVLRLRVEDSSQDQADEIAARLADSNLRTWQSALDATKMEQAGLSLAARKGNRLAAVLAWPSQGADTLPLQLSTLGGFLRWTLVEQPQGYSLQLWDAELRQAYSLTVGQSLRLPVPAGSSGTRWHLVLNAGPTALGPSAETVPGLVLYPNPAQDHLQVETAEAGEYQIHSLTGQVLAQGRWEAGLHSLAVGEFPSGMYILHWQGAQGRVQKKWRKS